MDSKQEALQTIRHKCAACFRQFNKVEHLVDHMKISFHSEHEPICGICKKHCRFFDSLREHLIGPLPKVECAKQFSTRGCTLCLKVFNSAEEVANHKSSCTLSPAGGGRVLLANKRIQAEKEKIYAHLQIEGPLQSRGSSSSSVSAVSLGCERVGGGQDGSLDLCVRVCLVDDQENLIFHTYVKPQLPVTNYRFEITGIEPENLTNAMPLNQAREKIKEILYNGEAIWRLRSKGGKARLLVGHDVDQDLRSLEMEYPTHLIRDTAKYPPLMKTNKQSNSLKYLTQELLGYEIQRGGTHEPYEDCVATMRLYKRMISQVHSYKAEAMTSSETAQSSSGSGGDGFSGWSQRELEKMTPHALLRISRPDYHCWCLDATSHAQ